MNDSYIDHTHVADATSWVEGADAHKDFPVQNLPLGVFSRPGEPARIGTAIGGFVLDVARLASTGILAQAIIPDRLGDLAGALAADLAAPTLGPLFARDSAWRRELRYGLFALLTERGYRQAVTPFLYPAETCTLHLPFVIGDYSDFYSGIHHARNIGAMLRPDAPLLPNYRHVPIGYHGRASSVRVSGTPVVRPRGQVKPADTPGAMPEVIPTRRLDYELELGIWIAGSNPLGTSVPIAEAQERIGGLCLLNDWSARDIQAWEYQPLGPFLAKSFITTVSPWVITSEALMPFRTMQPHRPKDDPKILPYLFDELDQCAGCYALMLEVTLTSTAMRAWSLPPLRLSQTSALDMYWTAAQLVTHHTSNGCNLNPGDLIGTGTLSGGHAESLGCLMEITQNGTAPITLPSGETRTFLEDGDTVSFSAKADATGYRSIGFGTCHGVIKPAR